MTTSISKQRDYSLDVIKIISCILVVLMHSLRAFDTTVTLHPILYYLTRCSMPLFFMAAGAIQLNKAEIDFRYCIKKIKNIIFLMFAYYGVDFIIRMIFSHDISLANMIWMAKNCYWDFGVFWFLQTMIIIYIILPWFHKFYKKHHVILLLFFGVITLVLNGFNIFNIQINGADCFIEARIMQPLRLWTWLLYYTLGGAIYQYKDFSLSRNIQWIITFFTTVVAILYMYWMLFKTTSIVNGEYAYTSLSMMLWCSALMFTLLNTNFERIKPVISILSLMLIPVYALHYAVIHYIVIPLDLFSGYLGQLAGFLVIISITMIISFAITKISFLKYFIKI